MAAEEEPGPDGDLEAADRIFALQKEHRRNSPAPTIEERRRRLRAFRAAIVAKTGALEEALAGDLHKPPAEVALTELYPVISEIVHAIRKLPAWARPRRISSSLAFPGARGAVRREAKGVCLVLAPWNFPFQLVAGPLVSALAAGNSVIVKPSELAPRTSRFLRDLVASVFDEREAVVVEGGAALARHLTSLEFDHVFFTGSTAVGKSVMAAAAKTLASVTLELGGKSPAFVDESADFRAAARRLIWGKCLNAGQTCVAPDYALAPAARIAELVGEMKRAIEKLYGPPERLAASPDYCRIVTAAHGERLRRLVAEAVASGARIETGGGANDDLRFIEPTIVTGVPPESGLLREEIFGPVLPVVGYGSRRDAIAIMRRVPNPLALYVFARDAKAICEIVASVPSGDVVVNDVAVHFVHPYAPFGGVRQSGIGKSHGKAGFEAFTHPRTVLEQPGFSLLGLLYPPYTPRVRRLARFAARFLSGR